MVQFAERMNKFKNIEFYLLAINKEFLHRGKHWNDNLGVTEFIRYYNNECSVIMWIEKIINQIRPDIVFTGINRGEVFELLVKKKTEFNYKFGKWNEPYTPSGIINFFGFIRNIYYRKSWRKSVDFILAIDDRAVSLYRNFVSGPEKIFFFPYYEDTIHANEAKISTGPVRFLFSGRLYQYHNIRGLARAIKMLQKKYPGKFEFVVSASGKKKKYLDSVESRFPGKKFIKYDTEFEKWEDRLRPFKSSHVLVLPSYKSGWGLVVNEALNLGLPVITTQDVGAARYLVEHMINGMIIKPTKKEIFRSMEYFILNPKEITRMSANALDVNKRYSLDIGANRVKGIFEKILEF